MNVCIGPWGFFICKFDMKAEASLHRTFTRLTFGCRLREEIRDADYMLETDQHSLCICLFIAG